MGTLLDRIKYGTETIKNPIDENNFSYGKIEVDESKCICCRKCKDQCIVKAIDIKNHKAHIDQKSCMYCKNCISTCPKQAIKMTNDYKMSELEQAGNELKKKIYKKFKRSLVLRSVDTGSCNACMSELSATGNNYYDLSRFGVHFAASPRHADGIVVTGPVPINMKEALIKTYEAMPEPRLVIAVGSCAHDGGIFKDAYANTKPLHEILPVDLVIPGCPPSPQAIIYGLLKLMNRVK